MWLQRRLSSEPHRPVKISFFNYELQIFEGALPAPAAPDERMIFAANGKITQKGDDKPLS
jgi:hypothetical protein